MDIEKEIYSEEEYEKIQELRRKNDVDIINKKNNIESEKHHKEWRENMNAKVLNLGVRIRKEFKEMSTPKLLNYFKGVRHFGWGWNWDEDPPNDTLELLELRTELSQREHVITDSKEGKKERRRLAKKHKHGRSSHKKKWK